MFEHNRKQYIFKQSSGRTLNVFYKDNSGIYISSLNKRSIWTESTPLAKDTLPGFSADMDQEDNLYLIYQDRHGNILRGCYTKENWNVKPVLNSKNPSAYDKHLHVVCLGDSVYYFYVLEYSGNKLLSYQVQKQNGSLSTPKVIDYVAEAEIPFVVLPNLQNELYIFYKSNDKGSPSISYKTYNMSNDQWEEFRKVSDSVENGNMISAIFDHDGNLHLLWQKKYPQKFDLLYNSLSPGAAAWGHEKVIASSPQPFNNSSFALVNDLLLCYWIKDNSVFYITSNNHGEFWSKQEKYSFYENKPFYCMKFKQNNKEISTLPNITILPGNFVGGYKLAFLNDSELKAGTPDLDAVRTTFSDTLKLLSKSMEDLKRSVDDLKGKLQELDNKQEQNEMELSKISIKASLFENEVAKIRNRLETSAEARGVKNQLPKVVTPEIMYLEASTENSSQELSESIQETSHSNQDIPQAELGISKIKSPIMPGAGFASITPEFLQGLSKR